MPLFSAEQIRGSDPRATPTPQIRERTYARSRESKGLHDDNPTSPAPSSPNMWLLFYLWHSSNSFPSFILVRAVCTRRRRTFPFVLQRAQH